MHMRLPIYGFTVRGSTVCVAFALLLCDLIGRWQSIQAQTPPIDYQDQVKALLRERCFACHGPLRQESNLRLDTLQSMLQGGDSGSVLLPGEPDKSRIIERVRSTDSSRMPPEHEGEQLKDQQIELLSRWIAQGAQGVANEQPDPDPRKHWAFQSLVRPPLPQLENAPTHPIDAFLHKIHSEHGLVPQTRAPNDVLLRRLSIDLIGLPPSPDDWEQLPKEWDSIWYESTIDKLLDDPRHGQRWARHWMDVWRFSDWWGLGDQLRNSQLHMWHWRDWIIEALNTDRPYDEMVRLMLAADEIAPENFEDLRATGFLARNYFLFNRNQWMDETIEHVSKAFLGLTLNCAKCHDHKYDPIRQVDYYRMRAIFEPYHVRLDALPGETDFSKNGLPRVFDAYLETPTYRFERGQESAPDKSTVMQPGIPEFLSKLPIEIQPVELPGAAWQPERRQGVIPKQIEKAKDALSQSLQAIQAAKDKYAKAQAEYQASIALKNLNESDPQAPSDSAKILVYDNFAMLDPARWKTFGGKWEFEPGKLSQLQDGQTRSVLRWLENPPENFDLTLRFTILGGSTYRSVGVSFDSTQTDGTINPGPEDSEVMVYVSAHGPDPKLQAAYAKNGQYHYPVEGRASHRVELNKQYTLGLQVRGQIINASLDGQPKVAWKSPLERRQGALQLTAFDVQVAFHEIRIQTLPDSIELRDPAGGMTLMPEQAFELAKLELQQAEEKHQSLVSEVAALEVRYQAWLARWALEDQQRMDQQSNKPSDLSSLQKAQAKAHSASILQDRQWQLSKAKLQSINTQIQLIKSPPEKKEAAQKEHDQSLVSLAKAQESLLNDQGELVRFTGAQWSATRFLNSGADDPKPEYPKTSSGRRTALARWITDPQNPLTARVAVNHIWNRHFGEPLVASVFDFGNKGTKTEHQALLDWLAAEFVSHGWSMKYLHKLILTSEAYRRHSTLANTHSTNAQSATEIDPDNRLLWRRNPIRIESQVVRDSILSLAGNLDTAFGGPSVPMSQQSDSLRRSLYFFHSNNDRNTFLSMFDEALVKECYRRDQSIVPQQALALSNSRLVLDSATKIADKIHQESSDLDAFIERAFREILGIQADASMIASSKHAMKRWRGLPNSGIGQGSAIADRILLVWTLLNHNDFVTLR
jgi:mono/diheme cytochrome c family protein